MGGAEKKTFQIVKFAEPHLTHPLFINNLVSAILSWATPTLHLPHSLRILDSDTRNNASNKYKYCALMNSLNRNSLHKNIQLEETGCFPYPLHAHRKL